MTQPRLLGGRYELDGIVGRGGMAEVFRARDIRLDRIVAVKTLRDDLARDQTFQARFRREAQSAASLNHPSIVAVYDTGEDMVGSTPVPYIVMEYVDGRTLRDLLRDDRRLLPERALEITDGVLRALDCSHRNAIVHRNVKPGHVMLTRAGDVKVMDFGIARAVSDREAAMARTGQLIGTAQYMSPEQARGERVDARSDLYSTGCLLYELLTGRPPFTGDSPVAIADQHVRENPVPPSRVDPEIPAWADSIVLKAMAKDPRDRYQSAGEMRTDIQRALHGATTLAATEEIARHDNDGQQPLGRRPLHDDVWLDPPSIPEPYASRAAVDDLVEYLARPFNERQTISVSQLNGEPGVGKTYVALRAAKQVVDLFPGGILYAIRPDRGPLMRLTSRTLLIADDVEGMTSESLLNLTSNKCALLIISRTPIADLPGPAFAVTALRPDEARRFVTELLSDTSNVNVSAEQIAERAQGLPLLAYLLVEEAKQHPNENAWLDNLPRAIPRFLDMSYTRLGPMAQKLLRRTALLRYDDVVDTESAAVLLESDESTAAASLEAVRVLFGGSRVHVDRAVREFADERLRQEDGEDVERLRSNIRLWRAERYGVLPRTRITRDFWTTDDLLGYRAFADAIAAFIRHRDTRPPLTIGVKGPWGSGKTSLMRMVQEQLDPRDLLGNKQSIELTKDSRKRLRSRWRRHPQPDDRLTMQELLSQTSRTPEPPAAQTLDQTPLRAQVADGSRRAVEWRPTVWFNPWVYQSEEQVWAGLAGEIIDQVASRLALGDRERFWLRLNLSRLDREAMRQSIYRLLLTRLIPPLLGGILVVAVAIPTVALHAVASGYLFIEGGSLLFVLAALTQIVRFLRQSASGAFGRVLHEPVIRAIPKEMAGTAATALRNPGYQAKAGFLHLVQTDIRRVINLVATPERPLIVFIDDLDRCSPSTVTQVIEAISLFLAGEFPDCIFLIAMEPDLLAAHVQVAYQGLVSALRQRYGNSDWSTLGWRFLDKIVQLPLSLPPIDADKYVNSYISNLLEIPVNEAANSTLAGALVDMIHGNVPTAEARESPDESQAKPSPLGQANVASSKSSADEQATSAPSLDTALVDRLEREIRLRHPSLDELANVATTVQSELIGESGVALQEEAIAAVDRVFDDLYSDASAWTAIRSAVPSLGTPNPREIKRYLNLFRFYMFITKRRQFLEGIVPPSDEQIAKLAALVIRWPHLLSLLVTDWHGETALERLEAAAHECLEDWHSVLREVGILEVEHDELRIFLRTGAPIARVSSLLI